MQAKPNHRRGITLLEVLISMGILTIGLVSVVSLLPAGRSMAVKASVYDRSTMLAANAAADLVNRGFLRSEKWANPPGKPALRLVVLDPMAAVWLSQDSVVLLREDAASSGGSPRIYLPKSPNFTPPNAISTGVTDVVFRSEDDPVYSTDAVGKDDAPLPKWSPPSAAPSRRAFQGTYSYLATLQSSAAAPPFWDQGAPAILTVVVFHRRDIATEPIQIIADGSSSWPIALGDGEQIKVLAKPGTMVLWADSQVSPTSFRWHRVLMATESENGTRASFTCEGGDPPTSVGNVLFVFPSSVASIELPVRLEGTSRWNQ